MKVVLVMFKDGERRDFPLSAAKTVLGRKDDCGLRIPTPDVSRAHCEVESLDTEITIRDLGSANGTYVNGKRIAETTLSAGDHISIGPVQFVVQIDGQPTKIVAPPAPAESDADDSAAPLLSEDDLFELETDDFDDDPMSALEISPDDDEVTR